MICADCAVGEPLMQAIISTFFKGLLAFLPIFVTVYAVYYFGLWLNGATNRLLTLVVPDIVVVPGLGIVVGAIAIFLLGLLISSRLTRWVYNLVETPLRHLPIIKELYIALKQLADFFSPKGKEKPGQVVSVQHPDHDIALIGLLMRDHTEGIGFQKNPADRVAVFLPMSYQIGGFTIFVPRAWTNTVDIPVEVALRETLTGWIKHNSKG
jgi:uncharacterized membrane protein